MLSKNSLLLQLPHKAVGVGTERQLRPSITVILISMKYRLIMIVRCETVHNGSTERSE